MKSQKIAIGLVAVALFVGSVTTHATDFDVGYEAYLRGDYSTALRVFRQLADQGEAEAQNILGIMYDQGQGVTQDYTEGTRWYRKAAEQGNTNAQYNLGIMYDNGRGVAQDYVQAHMWFNLAAAKGGAFHMAMRDRLAEKMTPAQIAEPQRLAREWKPKGK